MKLPWRIGACILAILSLLPVFGTGRAEALSVSGSSACLYLPDADLFLYEKDAHARRPMASTTKIMTALVVIDACRLDETVTVDARAAGVEGSSIYLQAGEKQTVENLLYALLLESANDAAAALALHVSGSIDGFADRMNARAAEMGLRDTHFTNPHGLADPDHYTTAAELAKIAAEALRDPVFRRIAATRHKVISVQDGKASRSLSNHNRLLRQYPDCIGVKTGFTRASGRCLVSAAERDGLRLIAVTLNAPDDWRDHTAMLNTGFAQYEARTFDPSAVPASLPVAGGVHAAVKVAPPAARAYPMKKTAAPLETRAEVNCFLTAPVKEGQVVGILRVTQDGKTVEEIPLLASESVAAMPQSPTLWDKLRKILNL